MIPGLILVKAYRSGVMVDSNAVPNFLPSTNGLHFANSFPPGPTVTFGPFDPRVSASATHRRACAAG